MVRPVDRHSDQSEAPAGAGKIDLVQFVRAQHAASPFRDTAREDRLLVRLRQWAVEEGLDPHQVERLYRVVLDMSVARQQAFVRALDRGPLRVAYQGTEGSYSHLAAQRRYSGRAGGVLLAGFDSFRQVAEAVLSGTADLALLPIENTTAGSINETYDLLAAGGLVITGEVVAAIEHCLLGLPGAAVSDLRAVLSHPQALAQCEYFFREHPAIRAKAEFDTAEQLSHTSPTPSRSVSSWSASKSATQRSQTSPTPSASSSAWSTSGRPAHTSHASGIVSRSASVRYGSFTNGHGSQSSPKPS